MKSTKCPCGQVITVPSATADQIAEGWASAHEYDVTNIICPKCSRHSTSGNIYTGKVTGWCTQKSLDIANENYRMACIDADNNEWYGRGQW